MNRHDYEGLRMLDPQCEREYTPGWIVACDDCGTASRTYGSRPEKCPKCGETDLDALNIREVTP